MISSLFSRKNNIKQTPVPEPIFQNFNIKNTPMKSELLDNVKERERDLASFILKSNHERINYFESDGILTYIVLDDGSRVKLDLFLHQLEVALSPKVFYRCGWSFIVNLTKIHEYWVLEYPFLVMENGEIIPVPQSEKNTIRGLVSEKLIMSRD